MNFLEIIIFIFTIITIKFIFKFDINKFLENSRKNKLNQLKNICPHTSTILENDKIILESYFNSPIGITQWQCRQCGLIVNSKLEVEKITNFYQDKNLKLLFKKQKEFEKKAKKLKLY